MSDKKPGFFEGLMAGLDKSDEPEEELSEDVKCVQEYIRNMELSAEDKGAVASWLLGDAVKSAFADAFKELHIYE